jgi:acyl-coenzyme A thioesterase PaaI-like protein
MVTTTREDFQSFGAGHLPGHLGVEILTVSREAVESRMSVQKTVMAPNGYLHAASVVALADTSCGYGCIANLPEGAIVCRATPVHLGRTTQVWDAAVSVERTGARIALFRCTQMVLWPK